jgi:transcriptional regulator with XRE-family HTH domain
MNSDKDALKRIFSVRLLQAMADAGLSQTALADKLEVDPPVISRWVCGRKLPSAASIARLSAALGVTADFLLGRGDKT